LDISPSNAVSQDSLNKQQPGVGVHQAMRKSPHFIVRPVKLRLPTDPARLLEIAKGGLHMRCVSIAGNDLRGGPVIAVRNEDRFSPMRLALSVEGFMVDGVGKRRRLVIGDDRGGAPLGRLSPARAEPVPSTAAIAA